MELGAFSISLSVADLERSREFYEKLGFSVTGGSPESKYLILVNGTTVIGLFEGMFEGNILTFNPGLSNTGLAEGNPQLDRFTDVRELQRVLEERGLELTKQAEPDGTGPADIALVDPDGNSILIDQFSDRPRPE